MLFRRPVRLLSVRACAETRGRATEGGGGGGGGGGDTPAAGTSERWGEEVGGGALGRLRHGQRRPATRGFESGEQHRGVASSHGVATPLGEAHAERGDGAMERARAVSGGGGARIGSAFIQQWINVTMDG
ncbi:unnamed protein product [Lampetra planeri]